MIDLSMSLLIMITSYNGPVVLGEFGFTFLLIQCHSLKDNGLMTKDKRMAYD